MFLVKIAIIIAVMDMYELLNKKSPENVRLELAARFKQCRKNKGLTQRQLSEKSLIPYGTIRQFEQKGKISLESLISIAESLDMLSDFDSLFNPDTHRNYRKLVDEYSKRR